MLWFSAGSQLLLALLHAELTDSGPSWTRFDRLDSLMALKAERQKTNPGDCLIFSNRECDTLDQRSTIG